MGGRLAILPRRQHAPGTGARVGRDRGQQTIHRRGQFHDPEQQGRRCWRSSAARKKPMPPCNSRCATVPLHRSTSTSTVVDCFLKKGIAKRWRSSAELQAPRRSMARPRRPCSRIRRRRRSEAGPGTCTQSPSPGARPGESPKPGGYGCGAGSGPPDCAVTPGGVFAMSPAFTSAEGQLPPIRAHADRLTAKRFSTCPPDVPRRKNSCPGVSNGSSASCASPSRPTILDTSFHINGFHQGHRPRRARLPFHRVTRIAR